MDAKWFSDFESATGFPHFIVEALASVIEAPAASTGASFVDVKVLAEVKSHAEGAIAALSA